MRRTDVADRYLGPMFRVVVIRTKKRKQSTDGDVEERGEHMQQAKTCIVETCKAQKAFLTMFRGWFEKLFFYGLMGFKKNDAARTLPEASHEKKFGQPSSAVTWYAVLETALPPEQAPCGQSWPWCPGW